LLTTWFDEPHRATRDLDLLGFGDPSDDALLAVFREVMTIAVDDGLSFDAVKLKVQPIREDLEYGGSRLSTTATLSGARIPIVVDVGFGDAIEPGAEDIDLPVLLDMPSPRLRAYPLETVIAEKLHAMVLLGMANSRMKDYYDVWMLTRSFALDPVRLRRAVDATFARRGMSLLASVPEGTERCLRGRCGQAGAVAGVHPQPLRVKARAERPGRRTARFALGALQARVKVDGRDPPLSSAATVATQAPACSAGSTCAPAPATPAAAASRGACLSRTPGDQRAQLMTERHSWRSVTSADDASALAISHQACAAWRRAGVSFASTCLPRFFPRPAAPARTASPLPRRSIFTRSREDRTMPHSPSPCAAWRPIAGGQPILQSLLFHSEPDPN
ncbi:MAG: nucleotidyl transferase AbiEii/AbiGii toxin family protein, partial [Burkholderiaceae bacterium]|nr:nucleotidyl transferase AbiEii/AbiGii toxin family protein [Burkholderiaceae bacterium]